jgi:hypothetical protein
LTVFEVLCQITGNQLVSRATPSEGLQYRGFFCFDWHNLGNRQSQLLFDGQAIMRTRKVYLRVRMTLEESQRLATAAQRWGYKTATEFVRASLGQLSQLAEEMHNLEKCQAATMSAMRTDIARVERAEYVLFAMLENLAKTVLT